MKRKLFYSIVMLCFAYFGVLAQTHTLNVIDTSSITRSAEPIIGYQLIVPCTSAIPITAESDSILHQYTINGSVI